MGEVVSSSLGRPRLAAGLLSGFALLALVLGMVGVYGVLSHAVSRRTHEIGIRMALGSRRRALVRSVILAGLRPVVAGLVVGLPAAWAVTRTLEGMLFEVGAVDPLTYATVAGMLVAVGLLAGWVPARRASSVDPIIALRR